MPDLADHPGIGRANYVYPAHYAPSDRAYDFQVRFVANDGQTYSGQGLRVPAGAAGTWEIELTNREADLPAGAVVAFLGFGCQFFYRAQGENPQGRDYVTLEADTAAELVLFPGRGRHLGDVGVKAGALRRGETMTVRWGDPRAGSVGSEVYWTATPAEIWVAVDPTGEGQFYGARHNPFRFEIVAHPEVKLLRLLGPTVARAGEPFAFHLAAFDRNRNVADAFEGSVRLDAPAGLTGLPARVDFGPEDGGIRIIEGVSAAKPGVYRVEARTDAVSGARFVSNPMVVTDTGSPGVHWGDVHCHGWGDNSMYLMHLRTAKVDPRGRHDQARRVGRFDFAAPGPMALPFEDREEVWAAYQQAAREVDAAGSYVPLLSYEAHPPEGDRNVVFKSIDEPAPAISMREPMAEVDRHYGGRDDVFLEVHIGGHPPEWEKYKTDRERMVEVVSGFGNAEWLLQRALRRGYRPTVVGASDLHVGLMGGPRAVETARGRFGYAMSMNQRDAGYGSGPVTAAIVPELTRDAIWQAMAEGRTYATTGARIYLTLSCNRAGAGGRAQVGGKLAVSIECHACVAIERVDLIAGDRCLRSWRPGTLDFEVDEELDAARVPGEWAYVRVRQVDAEYAWSALVWLDREGPVPTGEGLPLWNEHEPVDLASLSPNDAEPHLAAVGRYLETEESRADFGRLTPACIVDESMGRAALFLCHYGPERRPMSIRWFFEFEIPKIRYDFGWRDFGMVDEAEVSKWGE